ncbi:uncharacterized protein LOC142571867 isoform X2 [Dermacentor variabilis]|uniref:uncharacterized protein LOC142571867 isoform X2 n=1 Tax=Dermacentor variabilis TaxID=34621 RepID=UPI003F5BEC31
MEDSGIDSDSKTNSCNGGDRPQQDLPVPVKTLDGCEADMNEAEGAEKKPQEAPPEEPQKTPQEQAASKSRALQLHRRLGMPSHHMHHLTPPLQNVKSGTYSSQRKFGSRHEMRASTLSPKRHSYHEAGFLCPTKAKGQLLSHQETLSLWLHGSLTVKRISNFSPLLRQLPVKSPNS